MWNCKKDKRAEYKLPIKIIDKIARGYSEIDKSHANFFKNHVIGQNIKKKNIKYFPGNDLSVSLFFLFLFIIYTQ